MFCLTKSAFIGHPELHYYEPSELQTKVLVEDLLQTIADLILLACALSRGSSDSLLAHHPGLPIPRSRGNFQLKMLNFLPLDRLIGTFSVVRSPSDWLCL